MLRLGTEQFDITDEDLDRSGDAGAPVRVAPLADPGTPLPPRRRALRAVALSVVGLGLVGAASILLRSPTERDGDRARAAIRRPVAPPARPETTPPTILDASQTPPRRRTARPEARGIAARPAAPRRTRRRRQRARPAPASGAAAQPRARAAVRRAPTPPVVAPPSRPQPAPPAPPRRQAAVQDEFGLER